MFTRILVPTDGSALSQQAAAAAIEFAGQHHAQIVAVSVAELLPFPLYTEAGAAADLEFYEEIAETEASRNLKSVETQANAAGVSCKTLLAKGLSAADEIIAASQSEQCDMIWIASHGRRGLAGLLLGSQTQKVLAQSAVPVLVFRASTVVTENSAS